MTDIRNLLLIDKTPAHAEAFREALLNAKDGPFQYEWVQTLSQSVERLREKTIWAIFANLSLPVVTHIIRPLLINCNQHSFILVI
jgi:hypothetical protein